jgi:hypothetical protein
MQWALRALPARAPCFWPLGQQQKVGEGDLYAHRKLIAELA